MTKQAEVAVPVGEPVADRAAFEAWARDFGMDLSTRFFEEGKPFDDRDTALAWTIWQAARAAAPSGQPPAREELEQLRKRLRFVLGSSDVNVRNDGLVELIGDALSTLEAALRSQPAGQPPAATDAMVEAALAATKGRAYPQSMTLGPRLMMRDQLEAALAAALPAPQGLPPAWQPIESYDDQWPVRIRAPELVDLDFNERGETDACALCGDQWYAAQWDNTQDFFETIEVTPTHWMPLPAAPAPATPGEKL